MGLLGGRVDLAWRGLGGESYGPVSVAKKKKKDRGPMDGSCQLERIWAVGLVNGPFCIQ